MASSLTKKEEELLERIRGYDREFFKLSHESFEAMKRNDKELQLRLTYAALHAAGKGNKLQKELAELELRQRQGACTRPRSTCCSAA